MAGPQKFFDPSQPQTLQIATFLLYLDAALLVLRGAAFASGLGLIMAAGSVGGAYGMANNRKWGYGLSIGMAFFGLVYPFLLGATLSATVDLHLAVALVALLLHPQSREYQRIWFS